MVKISNPESITALQLPSQNLKTFGGGTKISKLQTLYLYNNQITSMATMRAPVLQTLYVY